PLGGVDTDHFIFGPYFLVPFGLAVTVVILEAGLANRSALAIGAAIAAPVGLVLLSAVGHQDHSLYTRFLEVFTARLGGTPLYLTLLAAAGFYVFALARGVPLAADGLTAVLVMLAVYTPESLTLDEWNRPQPGLLLTAATLQFVLGLARR